MDPLSITTAVFALATTAYQIGKYGLDVKNAPKKVQQLRDRFETLHGVLELLGDRCKALEAREEGQNPKSPWLRSLLDVRMSNGETEEKGAVVDLRRKIEDVGEKLNPKKRWDQPTLYKLYQTYKRFEWPFQEQELPQIFNELDYCLSVVYTILAVKGDASLEEIQGSLANMLAQNRHSFDRVEEGILALGMNTGSGLRNIESRVSDLNFRFEEDQQRRERERQEAERAAVVAWLSSLSFIAKRKQLLEDCFTETGDWLWTDERFRAWTQGGRRSWFLTCRGDIGVGKTVLSSILMQHVSKSSLSFVPVLFLYLDYKSSSAQTVPALIGSLLKQLIQIDESHQLPDELLKIYKEGVRYGHPSTSYGEKMQTILLDLVSYYERFYIVVDGFDELPFHERPGLLKRLQRMCGQKGGLVITTRPTSEPATSSTKICSGCDREGLSIVYHCRLCRQGQWDLCYDCKSKGRGCLDKSHILREEYDEVQLTVRIPDSDIANYVRHAIGHEVDAMPVVERDERETSDRDNPYVTEFQERFQDEPELSQEVVTQVTTSSNGNFLFARLYMDALAKSSNNGHLKKILRNFPADLNQIYEQALSRIMAQPDSADRIRGTRILGLIVLARRPLSLAEAQHALVAMNDELNDDDVDNLEDFVDKPKRILGSSMGLVISETQANEVRLVHRSVEGFFFDKQGSNLKKWLPNAEREIAQACMKYLEYVIPRSSEEKNNMTKGSKDFPFIAYASQYWGDHVRDAIFDGSNPALRENVISLLNDAVRRNACIQTAWRTSVGGPDVWDVDKGVNRLHICAWYGLSSILGLLSPEASLVDKGDQKYRQTPLMYACRRGHVEAARYLLKLGASQRIKSARGRTALFEAILGQDTVQHIRPSEMQPNNEKVVELLIKEPGDLDINAIFEPESKRTALMLAARRGNLEMVQILLTFSGINIDLQDHHGMTALSLAIREKHEEIVRALLDKEASLKIVDFQSFRSPLRQATERDFARIVQLLLECGADADFRDKLGGTAVLRAVNRDARSALDVMIKKEVNLQCVDEEGQSLLHGAAYYGHADILRTLLRDDLPQHQTLKPDIRDKYGMTPLHQASRRTYEKASLEHGDSSAAEACSVLLSHGADATLADEFGRTPFTIAWQYGSEKIMRMLRDSGLTQVLGSSTDARSLPVWALARQGMTELVKEAVEKKQSTVFELEPVTNNTCLQCAAETNHDEILSIILESGLVDLDARNKDSRTALHDAALLGHSRVVDVLLEFGANKNARDKWHEEPIVLAHSNAHMDIMVTLIEYEAAVDKQRIDLTELYFYCVENGHTVAVKLLLEEYGIDRSIQNNLGLTALQIAKVSEDQETIAVLQSAPTMDFGAPVRSEAANSADKTAGDSRLTFKPFRARPVDLDEP